MIAQIRKIAERAGVENLTPEAAKDVQKLLEDVALKVISEASELAHRAGRREVVGEDIFIVSGKKRL